MTIIKKIHNDYKDLQSFFDGIIDHFDFTGEVFGKQDRNVLKVFSLDKITLNVKSFKIPNPINQIAYRFFRKSKARRSYEYANRLIEMNIGTPQPIAFYEFTNPLLFKKSFYISEHQTYDLTYRDLTMDLTYPNHEEILRAFTRFTFQLHEKNIHFLDHSPGNTLIKKTKEGYDFYLVDLNRMEFEPMDFKTRIKNFSRLNVEKSMVAVISDEYAKISGEDYQTIFDLMWHETQAFQEKFYRKRRIKRQLKFWKSH